MAAIPYTVKITTGAERSMGTDSNVYVKIIGTKKRHTGKQFLELLGHKKAFQPGSVETFSLEAIDVGEVRQIDVRNRFLRSTHIKFGYIPPSKNPNCATVVQSSTRTVADRHGLAAYHNKHC